MQKLLLSVLVLCSLALAQQKPTIAVSVFGEGVPENKKILAKLLEKELMTGGYTPLARDSSKLGAIGEEHIYMHSGAVKETQIAEIGRQRGAKCMCVVDIIKDEEGLFLLNASLVEVEGATQTGIGNAQVTSLAFAEIEEGASLLAKELLSSDMCGQGFLNITTNPERADLSFNDSRIQNCLQTPCRAGFNKGSTIRIAAKNEFYEPADTIVTITRTSQNISLKLKPSFGFLEIKPPADDMGKDKKWSLILEGKEPTYSMKNKLPPGRHKIELANECYLDIDFTIDIAKDGYEVFNVPQKQVKPKLGSLDLSAVSLKDSAKAVEGLPIYANGKKIGSTPYSGPVPVCSKIEIGGKKKMLEDLNLKYMDNVKYIYETDEKSKSYKTYVWAAALNVVGIGLLYASYKYHKDAQDVYLGNYYSLRGDANYDEAFDTLRKAEYARNGFFVTGILSLAVGGFLWF